MKLHSLSLDQACVSPQVFHGSMRLTGGGRLVTTGRGVKPSRQWSYPWQPQAGGRTRIGGQGQTIERSQAWSPRMSHKRLFKAQAKRRAVWFGFSNVTRREQSTAGVQSGPKSIPY